MSDPTLPELLADARGHARGKRYDQAIESYDRAMAIAPGDADLHMTAGTTCFLAGRHERALELFERVTRLTPAHASALVNMGAILNRVGRPGEAVDALQRALTLERDLPEGYYNLAIAHRKLGRQQRAVDAYREAIRLNPDFAEAHQNLGNLYLEMGQPTRAIAAFQDALKVRPKFDRAQRGLDAAVAASKQGQTAFNPFGRLVGAPDQRRLADAGRELSEEEREKDRRELRKVVKRLELRTEGAIETYRDQLDPALHRLEHAILGTTGSNLRQAAGDFEMARETTDESFALLRRAGLELRAHEELVRTPVFDE